MATFAAPASSTRPPRPVVPAPAKALAASPATASSSTPPHLAIFLRAVKLPVMPEVAHALIRSLQDPAISMQRLTAMIAQDPVLTAKVLRAANGAASRSDAETTTREASGAARHEVQTLEAAVLLLGLAHIRMLALAACMNVSFPVAPGMNRTRFWRNSLACAGYAQWLAEQSAIEGLDPQRAWLAGMMLRLGELLILQAPPQGLAIAQALGERQPHVPGSRWACEQKALGFTEMDVTAELAQCWNFPADMVQALRATASPLASDAPCPLAAVLHLASHLADLNPGEAGALIPETLDLLPADVLTALGLEGQALRHQTASLTVAFKAFC